MSKKLIFPFLVFGCLYFACGAQNKTIHQELKSTPDGQLFYAPIELGQEGSDKQTFNLLVATTYYMTWIASKQIDPIRGYENKTALPARDSISVLYKTGANFLGYEYEVTCDRWQVGEQFVDEQQFALARPSGHGRDFPREWQLDGMLGLSGGRGAPAEVDYLFRNLLKLNLIDHLKYSLYINNSVELNEQSSSSSSSAVKGALVFGGVDEKYYTGEFSFVRLAEDPNRSPAMCMRAGLLIKTIHLDWSRTNRNANINPMGPKGFPIPESILNERVDLMSPEAILSLDSTTKLFVGDHRILDRAHVDILGAKKIGKRGVYVFDDCRHDNKPDFVFTLDNGLELFVTPEDYLIDYVIEGRRLCLSGFRPFEHISLYNGQMPPWTFGTKFLRKFYTVFDFENMTVAFAKPT